jgi:hypothetical protein
MEIAIIIVFAILISAFLYYPFYNENKKDKDYIKSQQKMVQDIFTNEPLAYNIFQTDEFRQLPDDVANRIIDLTIKEFNKKGRKIYGNNILAKEAYLNQEVDLNGCFEWNKTNEGHDYWKNLHINHFKREFK